MAFQQFHGRKRHDSDAERPAVALGKAQTNAASEIEFLSRVGIESMGPRAHPSGDSARKNK